jgi:hypothetical protein
MSLSIPPRVSVQTTSDGLRACKLPTDVFLFAEL